MKAKVNYHAYKLFHAGGEYIGVERDPGKLLVSLAEDMKATDGDGGLHRLIIGQVWGDDRIDARRAVKADEWLPDGFADCIGVQGDKHAPSSDG